MKEDNMSLAFDAMIIFLDEYWKRGERSSSDIAVLLGSLGISRDGLPIDIALWDDWEKAYKRAESKFSDTE